MISAPPVPHRPETRKLLQFQDLTQNKPWQHSLFSQAVFVDLAIQRSGTNSQQASRFFSIAIGEF